MAYKHGKNGRVIASNSTLKVIEWDGEYSVDDVEATNTESGGFQEMQDGGGIAKMNGSVRFIVVDGQPPNFAPGQLIPLQLFEGSKSNGYQYSMTAYVSNFKRSNVVKATDPITCSMDYKSSSVITVPTS